MSSKTNFSALALIFVTALYSSILMASDKPVQHLNLPDVTSVEQAKQVFIETTAQLKERSKLDAAQLNEIHIITYSLEKALAYFTENMTGKKQTMAKKMAELVELVHIGSENNRAAETGEHLTNYYVLADKFSMDF